MANAGRLLGARNWMRWCVVRDGVVRAIAAANRKRTEAANSNSRRDLALGESPSAMVGMEAREAASVKRG